MEVTALIGASGTGKSYKAIMIAKELGIQYIIDDGLLINETRVLKGKSAKKEKTIVQAVKTAIFMDKEHREKVIEAINVEKPNKILIIGTSEKMVEKIAKALSFPQIDQKIFIEDISNEEEMKLAKQYREKEGKHVIPVPTFEIKKDFSGYFIDTLRIFKRKRESNKDHIYEKTVVRPTFSYLGKYTISNKVIKQLIHHVAKKVQYVSKVYNIYINSKDHGVSIKINAVVIYGKQIKIVIEELQEEIIKEIENMTSLNILSVDVIVKKMIIK